jgi:diguanylate cyclase (GGDEF)-like protein
MQPDLRILMLEDVASDAELEMHALKRSGVSCEWRRVEAEAEFVAQLQAFNPHLIVADFTLPSFDGLSALRLARAIRPDIPFIFVSGTIGEERAIEALKQGAADYVLKTNLARLAPSVERAVRDAEEHRSRERQAEKMVRLEGLRMVQNRIGSAALRIRNTRELLQEACSIAVDQGNFRLAWAVQIVEQPFPIELIASRGHDEGYFEEAIRGEGDVTAVQGLIRRALRQNGPVVVNYIGGASDFSLKAEALARGYRSAIALPLAAGAGTVAMLVLFSGEAGFFGAEETRLLADLADDISFALEFIAKEKKLNALAYHDMLTGLANRQLLTEHLRQEIALAHRLQRMIALVFIDLDHFKSVNDTLGHNAGDRLLKEIAARLASCTREGDIVSRFGGDEFVMVLPNIADHDALVPLIQRVLDSVSQGVLLDGHDVTVTCSIGVALYPRDGTDLDTLLNKADATMYRVKQRGRGEFLFHRDETDANPVPRPTVRKRRPASIVRERC